MGKDAQVEVTEAGRLEAEDNEAVDNDTEDGTHDKVQKVEIKESE